MSLINDALKRAKQSTQQQGAGPASGAPMTPIDGGGRGGGSNHGGGLIRLLGGVVVLAALGGGGWFLWKAYAKKKAATTAQAPEPGATRKSKTTNNPAAAAPATAASGATAPKSGATLAKTTPPTAIVNTNAAKSNAPASKPGGIFGVIQAAADIAKKRSADTKAGMAELEQLEHPTGPATDPNAVAAAAIAAASGAPGTPGAAPGTPGAAVAGAAPGTPGAAAPAATSDVVLVKVAPPVDQLPPENPSVVYPAIKINAIYYRVSRPTAMINGQNVKVGDVVDGMKVRVIERDGITMEFNHSSRTFSLR